MIKVDNFSKFDDSSDEGKLLLAAMSILTSVNYDDIESHKFGSMSDPSDVFDKVIDIANHVYFEKEYKRYLISINREDKISEIIN